MAGASKTIAAVAVGTPFRVLQRWKKQCNQISNGCLQKFQKKISLLAVAILFLFTYFNLILDAPRTQLCFLLTFVRKRAKKRYVSHNIKTGNNISRYKVRVQIQIRIQDLKEQNTGKWCKLDFYSINATRSSCNDSGVYIVTYLFCSLVARSVYGWRACCWGGGRLCVYSGKNAEY